MSHKIPIGVFILVLNFFLLPRLAEAAGMWQVIKKINTPATPTKTFTRGGSSPKADVKSIQRSTFQVIQSSWLQDPSQLKYLPKYPLYEAGCDINDPGFSPVYSWEAYTNHPPADTSGPFVYTGPLKISAGGGSSFVLDLLSGNVGMWGDTNFKIPTLIILSKNIKAIAAKGLSGSSWPYDRDPSLIALTQDGEVLEFELDPRIDEISARGLYYLTKVPNLSDVTQIASGSYWTNSYLLALKKDGTVWEWDYCHLPKQVLVAFSGGQKLKATAIAAGRYHYLALQDDGTVMAWGINDHGQLGTPPQTIPSSNDAIEVEGLNDVIAIAAGAAHSLALKSNGEVWSWGANGYGARGHGPKDTAPPGPVKVNGVDGENLKGVSKIWALEFESFALKGNGILWKWGKGRGMSESAGLYEAMNPSPLINEIIDFAPGGAHYLVLKKDDTVWAWGRNNYYQLGNGETSDSATPVKVNMVYVYESPPLISD